MVELIRRSRSRRHRRGRSGFSLLEVLIAIAVLGTGLLAITAAQVQAMRGGRYGKHSTQASVIANSQMEQLKRTRWTALAPTAWTPAQVVDAEVLGPGGNQVDQSYNVQWRITDLVVGETRAVDVRVTWNEVDRPNRNITYSSIRFNMERL